MPIPFLIQLAIGIGMSILSYILRPQPKPPKPPSLDDFNAPTADAGRPWPVIWGSMTITGVNNIGSFDKKRRKRKIKAAKK